MDIIMAEVYSDYITVDGGVLQLLYKKRIPKNVYIQKAVYHSLFYQDMIPLLFLLKKGRA